MSRTSRRPVRVYAVAIGANRHEVAARTRGAAARKAFREWLKWQAIKRQPKSSDDGWFDGVSIAVDSIHSGAIR